MNTEYRVIFMVTSIEHYFSLVWNCEHSGINPLTSNENFSYLLSFAFYLQLSCVIMRGECYHSGSMV